MIPLQKQGCNSRSKLASSWQILQITTDDFCATSFVVIFVSSFIDGSVSNFDLVVFIFEHTDFLVKTFENVILQLDSLRKVLIK